MKELRNKTLEEAIEISKSLYGKVRPVVSFSGGQIGIYQIDDITYSGIDSDGYIKSIFVSILDPNGKSVIVRNSEVFSSWDDFESSLNTKYNFKSDEDNKLVMNNKLSGIVGGKVIFINKFSSLSDYREGLMICTITRKSLMTKSVRIHNRYNNEFDVNMNDEDTIFTDTNEFKEFVKRKMFREEWNKVK